MAVIDDLKYLRKGGRSAPPLVAVAGGMLGIKPLITIKEGKVAMAARPAVCQCLRALFKKIEELGGINRPLRRWPVTPFPPRGGFIQTYLRDNLQQEDPSCARSLVIGTHSSALGLAFFDKDRAGP